MDDARHESIVFWTSWNRSITVTHGPMGPVLWQLFCDDTGHYEDELSADTIMRLQEGLGEIFVTLMDLGEAEEHSFTVKWSMKEVRELVYDTQDSLDECENPTDGAAAHRNSRTMSWLVKGLLKRRRPQIAEDFSKLLARVNDVSKRLEHVRLDLDEAGVTRLRPQPSRSADISVHLDTGIVVIEEQINKLVELLAFDDQKEEQLKVVPIFGFTGVGKTTLATSLYRRYKGKFQCRAFLRVSRDPDMRRILTSLLSQIKAVPAHDISDLHDLIDSIKKHLQGKRFFIIIDDIWTTSVWYILKSAFPDGDCYSRIVTTTQTEDVALASCGYQHHIFHLGPLDGDQSKVLFIRRVFGTKGVCPPHLETQVYKIISKCGGYPLAIVTVASLLASEPNLQQWEHIGKSLSSTLRIHPTSEGMTELCSGRVLPRDFKKILGILRPECGGLSVRTATLERTKEILNFVYNKLPTHLKTCLLYLGMFPEDYTIKREDLVKQWVAEGLVKLDTYAVEWLNYTPLKTARGYFDELVLRGMVQPVDTNYNGEVLSCKVSCMVLDLIRRKSMEENFITILGSYQTAPQPDKVRRLSVQLGGAQRAQIPESWRMSQLRSLMYCGLLNCMPSIVSYELLRVLVLYIWADAKEETIFDLSGICALSRLRYLKIECNITVKLPAEIGQLKHLETLEVPSEARLPAHIFGLTSLLSMGYFDLSKNSRESVMELSQLRNLRELHLTCSLDSSNKLKGNTKCLFMYFNLEGIECLTLAPGSSSHVKVWDEAEASSMGELLESMHSLPNRLEIVELSPQICIFCQLPQWIAKSGQLRVLKIALTQLPYYDLDILMSMNGLVALSLSVSKVHFFDKEIVIGSRGLQGLTYFKFTCPAPCLVFKEGAMPNVQRLMLRFNANLIDQYNPPFAGIEYLSGLKEISAKVGNIGYSLKGADFTKHPNNPSVNLERVDKDYSKFA